MPRMIETSQGTFESVTKFAKHFGFKYNNVKKIVREGRVEDLFSGLFMGYDPAQMQAVNQRLARAAISRRISTYKKVKAYVESKIELIDGSSLESTLITTERDYVYAKGADARKVTLSCSNKEHPTWTVISDYLTKNKSWCGHCQKSVKKTDNQVNKELESRGLRLLSDYNGANVPISIECKNGHISTLTLSKIVNGHVGCPYCFAPREEAIVRHYLENFLGVKFDQVRKRPLWLYKISGSRLELDGFCSTHRIAFEYQGEHHYKKIGYCGAKLEKVQARDAKKLLACEAAGVRLIVVPTLRKNWSDKEAEFHVFDVLTAAGFSPVIPIGLSPKFVKVEPEKLALLNAAVLAKGGKLLEAFYNGYHRGHLIRCGCGNEWTGSPASIFRGCWCPECGRVKSLAGAVNFRKNKAPEIKNKNLNRLRMAAEAFGRILIDTEYVDDEKYYSTQCKACGDIRKGKPQSIYRGYLCKPCQKNGNHRYD